MNENPDRLLFLLLFICFSTVLYAQKKKQAVPVPSDVQMATPLKTNYTRYSLSRRLSFYPFSQAVQVQLVSFGLKIEAAERRSEHNFGLPILNDTISFDKLDQRRSLTIAEIDSLSDLLYNTCPRWKYADITRMGCYNPRNAILFFDTAGKVFEYMEICFECHGFKSSSKKGKALEECDPFYEEVQAYFDRLGLETSYLPLHIPPPPVVEKES